METARHPNFKKLAASLSKKVQEKAKETYKAWKEDHNSVKSHPVYGCDHNVFSLGFTVDGTSFRVLGIKTKHENKDRCVWFWIGSHEDYNNFIPSQRQRLKNPDIHIVSHPSVQGMLDKIKTREELADDVNKHSKKAGMEKPVMQRKKRS